MSHGDREALLKAFTAAWTASDIDSLMELMTDDCEFRASVGPEPGLSFVGREQVRRGYQLFLQPTDAPASDPTSIETMISDDFAVTRWTARQRGPGGNTVEVRACDIFEFDADRIKVKDTYRKVPG